MAVQIGINGYGRVAKSCLRASFEHPGVNVVAVNSVRDPDFLAHALKYDSVYGPFAGEVKTRESSLVVNGKEIQILSRRDPAELPWDETGAEVVLEATGAFNHREQAAAHFQGGAKKVIITAPGKDVELTVVMGVNEGNYDPAKHHVVSNASCTTNCLAVVARALHDRIGIERALMTTVHSYTNDQRLLDGSHSDPRRSRAAGVSMIPTTTGAARSVGLVLPALQGKINGTAIRVPTFAVSLIDIVAELKRETRAEDVNRELLEAARGELRGYLDVSDEPLVSIDYRQNPYSAVVDALSTLVLESRMVKIIAWYDNEWGYALRALDLASYLAQKGL